MGILTNIKNRGLKDILSPTKIGLYIRSLIWSVKGIGIKPKDALLFSEMVVYRKGMCPQCAKAGECVGNLNPEMPIPGCGCPTPELFADPQSSCVASNWAAYSKDSWQEEFKKDKKMMQLSVVSKFG